MRLKLSHDDLNWSHADTRTRREPRDVCRRLLARAFLTGQDKSIITLLRSLLLLGGNLAQLTLHCSEVPANSARMFSPRREQSPYPAAGYRKLLSRDILAASLLIPVHPLRPPGPSRLAPAEAHILFRPVRRAPHPSE